MRDIQLILSVERLEAIVGLLTGLISILLCIKIRKPEERAGDRNSQSVEQKTMHKVWGHIQASHTVTILTSEITVANIIIVEKFKYYKNYQNVTASKMWANAAGKNGAVRVTGYRVAKTISKKLCICKIAIKWGMYKVCFRTSVDSCTKSTRHLSNMYHWNISPFQWYKHFCSSLC